MRAKRNSESGFAVLFIYAMAATVAIMLFMELPRVAFEAQRDREQLLIDRGEQYTRAVTLFVRKFNRFPADMDALQNTQNLRFLRRKYVDPMTGKDDWRIIHVGTGGVFTDSLVYTNNKQSSQQFAAQNFITEMQQTGGNQGGGTSEGVNIGLRQRPSDQPGAPGDPNAPQSGLIQPGQIQSAFPQAGFNQPSFNQPGQIQPGFPQTGVPQPGFPQPGFPQPGFPQGGVQQFDANGQPISSPSPNPVNAPFPNQTPNGNGFPGGTPGVQSPQNPFFGGVPGQQTTTTFGQQPTQQPGQPATGGNPGTNLINQLLTTPRPGGLNGLLGGAPPSGADQFGNPITNPNGAANNVSTGALNASGLVTPAATPGVAAPQVIGGGMAGVASKYEQEGIKVYKDQTSYNKWEFVYDITKDPTRGGGTVPQAAAPANGTTPMPNSFAPQSNSPFGTGNAPQSSSPFGTTNTPPPPPAPPTQTPVTPQ